MAHSWMPGARRIRTGIDGGPLRGGAPRAVWLTLGTAGDAMSIQPAAAQLIAEGRPCHLIWDPVTGEIAQLISILRAGCALGPGEHLALGSTVKKTHARTARGGEPGTARVATSPNVNREGRVCVQICVLGHAADPFTSGPLAGVTTIVNWLESWNVPRRWPAGPPADHQPGDRRAAGAVPGGGPSRALWALGGHFGASQVPGCLSQGPGRIDTDLLTGTHDRPANHRGRYSLSPAGLPVPV